jgi:Flp pilus assembly protein TadG
MSRSRGFLRSQSGNVALIFALAAIPASITVAAGIEWSRINSAKVKLDRATDAAALFAKKVQMENRDLGASMAKTNGELGGRKSFVENSAELSQVASNVAMTVSWDADESARVVGTADAKLMLGGLLGMSTVRISSLAVASSGSESFYEIAMVLDNTASMFEKDGRPKTRFTHLREAASSFVNAAFDNMGMPDRLRFSVIPFATSVNIKSEDTLGWNPASGPSPNVPEYGSRSLPSTTLNRNGEIIENTAALTTMFAPVGWRGCIAGNGESLSANDAPKSGMKWNALQVPPHPQTNRWRPTIDVANTCTTCTGTPLPPPPGPPPPPPGPPPPPPPPVYLPPPPPKKKKGAELLPRGVPQQYAELGQVTGTRALQRGSLANQARFLTFGGQAQRVQQTCVTVACTTQACDPAATPTQGLQCAQDSMKNYGPDAAEPGRRNAFIAASTSCISGAYDSCSPTMPTGTLSTCIADPNEIAWNNSGGAWCPWVPATNWLQFDDSIGPNVNCPMPMLGLSGSRPQILSTINRMSPVVGGTHNDVGLRWGLRSLSPRVQWANFFGNNGSKAPTNFSAANSKKALILITDGQNEEAEDFPGFWGCTDTQAPGCSGSPDQAELDNRMLTWCSAIRNNHDVQLYTVAVNISDPAAVAKLATCAGDPARAFAVDAADLNKTLETVAGSIFQLRLKE